MKRMPFFRCFPVIAVAALLLAACNRANEAHYTPDIRFNGPLLLHRPTPGGFDTDTLLVLVRDGRMVMDTLMVGDTVFAGLQFNTFLNNMQSIVIKHDTAVAEIRYKDKEKLEELFLPSSDIDKGEFRLAEGYSMARLQFSYVALKPSDNAQLKITLSSDSKFSPRTMSIVTPIVENDVNGGVGGPASPQE